MAARIAIELNARYGPNGNGELATREYGTQIYTFDGWKYSEALTPSPRAPDARDYFVVMPVGAFPQERRRRDLRYVSVCACEGCVIGISVTR